MARLAKQAPSEARHIREKLADLGHNLELWRVHIDELHEQEKNARVMDPKTFDRLTSNIARGGRLEQLPFCALRDGEIEVVSGHHRIRAARAAEVMEVFVIVDTSGLSRSEVVAKQLAHNAIAGTDDPSMLRELFAEIATVEDMIESHIDPTLLQVPEPQPLTDVKAILDWHLVSLLFLPASLEDFQLVLDRLSGDERLIGLCDVDVLPRFREAVHRVVKVHDIRAIGAVVAKMCDIVLEKLAEEEEALSS